ncbi:hypothetical protein phiV141_6 [Vibrio phage phiV141]|uniref:Uncharacterized protein n=1 Tax=Vibrio phage phiV141 TaxID=2723905 RepID=A0A7D7IF45_9CAUD|nr:hypothetical protein phiV141_6 [Vibrio phage phiV141]
MITTKVEWDKAHKNTAKLVVGSSEVVEKDENGNILRKHTLTSLFDQGTLENPSWVHVGQPCPAPQAFEQQAPQPPQPAVPGVAAPYNASANIEVNAHLFTELARKLKSHATDKNVRAENKLTLMEVHELLLAMKA